MKKILVPSDFSENSTTALAYAIELCKMTGADLVVFHCMLPPFEPALHKKTGEDKEQWIQQEMAATNQRLRKQVIEVYQKLGISVSPSMKIGVEMNPLVVEKIMEVAARQQADLIVMGTHGASGLKKVFFGSNTSNMVSKSGVPVLAIPADCPFTKIESIAMASDLDDFHYDLDKVVSFARALNAQIDILYLDFGIDPYESKEYKAIQYVEENPYKQIRFIKQKATIEQPLLKQLRKYVDEQKPEWLVMFPREYSFWEKILLHSKTEAMTNSLTLPLLSIKKRNSQH